MTPVQRREMRHAAQYFWAMSYRAMTEKNFSAMRDFAKDADQFELLSSLNGAVLDMISVAYEVPSYDPKVIQLGAKLPEDQVMAARAAVKTEIQRHAEKVSQQQAAKKKQQIEDRKASKTAYNSSAVEKVKDKLIVGEVYTASLPYSLKKKSRDLLHVDNLTVEVVNSNGKTIAVNQQGQVRILEVKIGKSYGITTHAVVEIV